MADTGEKYTEARRALLSSGGGDGRSGDEPQTAFELPDVLLGWFTDQAYNLILLAEDEARMLSHPAVEPEHLLLAITRHGNVQNRLGGRAGRVIFDAIVQIKGFGDTLELAPRRSPATAEVLRQAIAAAHARGMRDPTTEHLLIALGQQELTARILDQLGIPDADALVDAWDPVAQPPVPPAIIRRREAQIAEYGHRPPRPGPIPPIFERFTAPAREAVNAGADVARTLDDFYVEPVHLLLAALNANGTAATLRARLGWDIQPTSIPQHGRPQATGIFSDDARRIVAEDVLIIAERLHHRPLTTGHLLIALLESADERTTAITTSLPEPATVTAAIIDALADETET
jgi:ATP-dependent Clp protease ATP-binding subunit ClpA